MPPAPQPRWQTRFSRAGRKALVTRASKGIDAENSAVFAGAGTDRSAIAVKALSSRCLTTAADTTAPRASIPPARRVTEPAELAATASGTINGGFQGGFTNV